MSKLNERFLVTFIFPVPKQFCTIDIADPEFGENQRTMKRPCLTER